MMEDDGDNAGVSYRGVNWGIPSIEEDPGAGSRRLVLRDVVAMKKDEEDEDTVLPSLLNIDLSEVVNVSHATGVGQGGKQELLVEFRQKENANQLVEIRFHVPDDAMGVGGEQSAHDAPMGEEGTDTPPVPVGVYGAQALSDSLKAEVGEGEMGSVVLAKFDYLQCRIPRLRVNLEMCEGKLKMGGKTQSWWVRYDNISCMFLFRVPSAAGAAQQQLAVITLQNPVRVGTMHHFHIVLDFPNPKPRTSANPYTLEISEEELRRRYPAPADGTPPIPRSMTGLDPEIFMKYLKTFSGKKVFGPGKFKTSTGQKALGCMYKANQGHLFCLERSFFFLPKPPTYFHHQEVRSLRFSRAGGAGARTFELVVTMEAGGTLTFEAIPKEEHEVLEAWFKEKGLKFQGTKVVQSTAPLATGLTSSESDEEYRAPRQRGEETRKRKVTKPKPKEREKAKEKEEKKKRRKKKDKSKSKGDDHKKRKHKKKKKHHKRHRGHHGDGAAHGPVASGGVGDGAAPADVQEGAAPEGGADGGAAPTSPVAAPVTAGAMDGEEGGAVE